MIILRKIRIVVVCLTTLATGALPESKPGVIVETTIQKSEAEKAGLLPGDVILSWKRDNSRGDIQSPFDFFLAEIEQKPRGKVALEGLRGTQRMTWMLGPGAWGLKVRPELTEQLLSMYRECQALGKAASPAAETCQQDAVAAANPELHSWFALQAAEAFGSARLWPQAEKAYELAGRQARETGPAIAAIVLNQWAVASEGRGALQNAARRYQESLVAYQKLEGESLAVAADLNGLGSVARKRGDLKEAEDYSRRALVMEEQLAPGSLDVAISLNNLGNIAWARRDLVTAEQRHKQALAIRERLDPGGMSMAGSLNNLGLIAWQRDELERAEDYQLQALAIRRSLSPGSMDVAASYNNLGSIAWNRGDLARAESYYRQGLEIREHLAPDSMDLADVLNNLGLVAWRRGELALTEQYYRRALTIEQKHGAVTLELANILHNLAKVLWERGDYVAAHDVDLRALQIRQKMAPDSLEVAASLNALSSFAREQGNWPEAEKYSRQALEIESKSAPESLIFSNTLTQLGDIKQAQNDEAGAESLYRQALEIREKLAPGSTSHSESLAALARILWHRQEWDAAARLFDQALQALESQTARLGGTEEVRSSFRANRARYYADYIDLLIARKQPALALHVAERSRAQSFLEMLSAAHIDVNKGVDPDLLSQKRRLEQSINSKSGERIAVLNGKHTQEQVTALAQQIEKLLAQYQEVESRIRIASTGYADLTRPQSVETKQIQDELLDPDTILLEYSLGEEHSHLWMVSQNALATYELPKRSLVEAAARRAYSLLIQPNSQNQTEFRSQVARWNQAAMRLSRMVLGPVAARLHEKRLLIVADGALQYIPFEALPSPTAAQAKTPPLPLVVKHEIVYLPSVSVLAMLRRAEKTRKAGPGSVVVMADPVFDKEDARVRPTAAAQTPGPQGQVADDSAVSSADQLTRSASDSGLTRLPRLSYSRREADAILAVTPPGRGAVFVDFRASRAIAIGPEMTNYGIVHFATHGFLDSQHPELSGLVLSLVDEQGRPQNGFLDLQDIFNLNLSADLVVLSACQTALGKEIRGEGMLGLTRGFMYAGTERVMASLWNVDDVATAELMTRFYRSMQQDGLRPAAALRRAQMEMRKHQRWAMPYSWAGFQLQGEWR